jgi:hypothetical protein
MASSQVNSLEALIRSMKNSAWKESGSGKLSAGPSHAQQLLKQHLSEEQHKLEERRRLRLRKRPQAQPVMRRKGNSTPQSPSSSSSSSSSSSASSSSAAAASSHSPASSLNDSSASAARTDFSKEEGVDELQRQEDIWTGVPQAYSDETITCYHQHVGGSVHRFKYEVMIESDPAPVVAIARELDLMPNWHKFVSQSCIVENIPSHDGPGGSSFGGIWGYVELWFPWPLANRAMVVKCEVLDVLQETGAILVRLLSGDYDEGKLPTTSEQCPRLVAQNLTQIVPMEPLPDGTPRTKFILFVDTDFQTNLIPGFVIQFILKVMAPVVYTQVKNLLETEFGGDTQFRERMAACPEMYGSIAARVEAFLGGTYDRLIGAARGGGKEEEGEDGDFGDTFGSSGGGGGGGSGRGGRRPTTPDGYGQYEGALTGGSDDDEGADGSAGVSRGLLRHVQSAKSLALAATASFSDLQLLRRPLSAARQLSGRFSAAAAATAAGGLAAGALASPLNRLAFTSAQQQQQQQQQKGELRGEFLRSASSEEGGGGGSDDEAGRLQHHGVYPGQPFRRPRSSSNSNSKPNSKSSSSSSAPLVPPPSPMARSRSAASLRLVLRPPARSVPPPPVVPRFVDTVRRPSSSSSFSKASPSKASSSYLESRDLLGGATSNTPPGTPPRFAGGGDMSPGNRHRRYDQPTRLRPRARPQKRFDTQTSEKVRIVA